FRDIFVTVEEKSHPAAKEMQKLEGAWIVESISVGGKSARPPEKREFTFKGDTLTIRGGSEEIVTFKVDLSRKPAVIELTARKGEVGFVRQLALYELKGDTLRLSMAQGSESTP